MGLGHRCGHRDSADIGRDLPSPSPPLLLRLLPITGMAITDPYISITMPAATGLARITTTIATTGTYRHHRHW